MPKIKLDVGPKPSLKKYKGEHSYWYGFSHKNVAKRFSGDLTFCNEFCVKDEYKPVAVYHAANPDRSKGHKDYMLLQTTEGGGGLVRGMTPEEIEPFRRQSGLWCHGCNEVIYSIMRHNMQGCKCKSVSVDGGQDYFKVSFKKGADYTMVEIDLLTDKIKIIEEKRTRARR